MFQQLQSFVEVVIQIHQQFLQKVYQHLILIMVIAIQLQ